MNGFDTIGWYEHTAVWSYVALVAAYFAMFLVSTEDTLGLAVVALAIEGLFDVSGIIWLRKGELTGPRIGIFIAVILLSTSPVIMVVTAASMVPLVVIIGGSGVVLIAVVLLSNILNTTSRPAVHQVSIALSTAVFVIGIGLASMWFRKAAWKDFDLFGDNRTRVDEHQWVQVRYGVLIALVGSLMGAVSFYRARLDHAKNNQQPLMTSQPIYGSVVMPAQALHGSTPEVGHPVYASAPHSA